MTGANKSALQRFDETSPMRERVMRPECAEVEWAQGQELLQLREQQLRAVVQTASDAIISADCQGNVILWNDAAEAMFGYTASEMCHQPLVCILPGRYRQTHQQKWDRAVLQDLPPTGAGKIEAVGLRKDSVEFPIELSLSVWKTSGQIFFTAIIRDMTERTHLEARREAAYALLQDTIDGVNEPIMVIGTDYQVRLMNRAAKNDYQAGDDTESLHCFQVSHGRDVPCSGSSHPCPLDQVRQSMSPVKMVHEHTREDGEKRLYEILAAPLLGQNDTLTGIVESARDVTECRRAEAALRDSEERYRQLVECSPDGIAIQHGDRIVFINTAGIQLLGAAGPEQIIGRAMSDLGLPDMREVASNQRSSAKNGTMPLFETELARLDGIGIDVEIVAIPFEYQGTPAIQAIFRDISRRKRAEKALRQSEQRYRHLNEENRDLAEGLRRQSARQRDLLKGLISAQEDERQRVARELHDELGQALGGLALQLGLLKQFVASDPGQARSQLEELQALVTDTTDRMYDLILDLRPSVLDDLGLAAALRAYASRLLADTGIEFELDGDNLAQRLPPSLETALYRVFQEAMSNVVRHARAKHIRISLARHDTAIECEISDDGQGFDARSISSAVNTPRGLGLLGMRERVVQCGGKLEILSEPGRGTRIRAWIPLNGS